MGGPSYDRPVYVSRSRDTSSKSFAAGGTSSDKAQEALGRESLHKDLNPRGRVVTSTRNYPVVCNLDVTGSNKEFSRIFYDKVPMLHGQIEQRGYLPEGEFDICISATGDASGDYPDQAPIQVGEFRYGETLDKDLGKLFLEGGGGGQCKESYELSAHFFGNYCEMPNAKIPFFFFIADEAPYSELDPSQVSSVLGRRIQEPIDSKKVFSKLSKNFKGNVFVLQNPYCGRRNPDGMEKTAYLEGVWNKYLGKGGKVVSIYEEKSVIDVILGVIAMVSKNRGLERYCEDMKQRQQTAERIENVRKSLGDLENSL